MPIPPYSGPPSRIGKLVAGPNVTLSPSSGQGASVTISASVGGGGGSPLTTKGDLYGYDTAGDRVPVASVSGVPLQSASIEALGVGYGVVPYNMNAQQVVNSAGYLANESTFGINPVLGFELGGSKTFTSSQNYVGLSLLENITWSTGNFPGGSQRSVEFTPTWNINAVGMFTKSISGIIDMSPTLNSSVNLTSMIGVRSSPVWGQTTGVTITNYTAMLVQGNMTGSITGEATALSIGTVGGQPGASITAVCVALDVGWSGLSQGLDTTLITGPIFAIGTAPYASFVQGAFAIGNWASGVAATPTGAPTSINYAIDIQSTAFNQAGIHKSLVQPVVGMVAASVAPSVPAVGAGWTGFWYGSAHNTYWVVAYNNAGTMEYKYIPVNGTSVTWTNSNTLPT